MPDFNKGDFTQQGVAGHVNANLRLNEKRLINIDLTSNEEAEGCTITGTVTDLLNDKVYNIGSGGGGGDTYTETFELTKETTAEAVEDGGEYFVDLTLGDKYYVVPAHDITINVNDTDINMLHNYGYWQDDLDNPAYILYIGDAPNLMVPEAGTYTVKSISATVTGSSLVNCKTIDSNELCFYFTDNNDVLYYFANGAHDVDIDVPVKSITRNV